MYVPGGQNQDLFPFYSRPTGPYFHENVKDFPSNAHRLVRQSRGSWSVIGGPAGRHPQRQSEALHKVLCRAFFSRKREAARRDTRSHRAGIQKRRAAGPGRSGSRAVGTAWGEYSSPAAPREDGRPPSPPVILCSGFLSGSRQYLKVRNRHDQDRPLYSLRRFCQPGTGH